MTIEKKIILPDGSERIEAVINNGEEIPNGPWAASSEVRDSMGTLFIYDGSEWVKQTSGGPAPAPVGIPGVQTFAYRFDQPRPIDLTVDIDKISLMTVVAKSGHFTDDYISSKRGNMYCYTGLDSQFEQRPGFWNCTDMSDESQMYDSYTEFKNAASDGKHLLELMGAETILPGRVAMGNSVTNSWFQTFKDEGSNTQVFVDVYPRDDQKMMMMMIVNDLDQMELLLYQDSAPGHQYYHGSEEFIVTIMTNE